MRTMKLSEYSMKEIKTMLQDRNNYLKSKFLWKHKDRRYKALINEFEKRIYYYKR